MVRYSIIGILVSLLLATPVPAQVDWPEAPAMAPIDRTQFDQQQILAMMRDCVPRADDPLHCPRLVLALGVWYNDDYARLMERALETIRTTIPVRKAVIAVHRDAVPDSAVAILSVLDQVEFGAEGGCFIGLHYTHFAAARWQAGAPSTDIRPGDPMREWCGADSPTVGYIANMAAVDLLLSGAWAWNLDRVTSLLDEAGAIAASDPGTLQPLMIAVTANKALLAQKLGRHSEAIDGFDQALSSARAVHSEDVRLEASLSLGLVRSLIKKGTRGEAGVRLTDVLDVLEATDDRDPDRYYSMLVRARTLALRASLGSPEAAYEDYKASATLFAQSLAELENVPFIEWYELQRKQDIDRFGRPPLIYIGGVRDPFHRPHRQEFYETAVGATRFLIGQGEFVEAAQLAKAARTLNPDRSIAWTLEALAVLGSTGDRQGALMLIAKAQEALIKEQGGTDHFDRLMAAMVMGAIMTGVPGYTEREAWRDAADIVLELLESSETSSGDSLDMWRRYSSVFENLVQADWRLAQQR